MKYQLIKVGDNQYNVRTPSFYALNLIKSYGYDLTKLPYDTDAGFINSVVAGLLTDLEPRDGAGTKVKVWTPDEVGDFIVPGEEAYKLMEQVGVLVADVLESLFPEVKVTAEVAIRGEAEAADAVPPAEASTGSAKRPASRKGSTRQSA